MNPFSLLRAWNLSNMRLLLSLSLVGVLLATGCGGDKPDPGPVDPPVPPTPTVTQLAFTTQPQGARAGVALAPFTVTLQDKDGKTVETGDTVSLTLAEGPSGAALPSAVQVTAQKGVASFSGLTFNQAGAGYVLQAQSGQVTGRSAAFSVGPGTASALAVTVQPADATSGGNLAANALKVVVRDTFGNTVTDAAGEVSAALVGGAGGTLSGTTRVAVQQGVATFNELSVDRAGEFRLAFTFANLTVESAAFRVRAGAATQLAFTVQPANTVPGLALTPAVAVTLLDSRGNVATDATGSVVLALDNNPGNAVLGGTTTVNVSQGVATFSTLTLDKLGQGYTLRATSGTLPAVTSAAFNVTLPVPTRLAFVQQPTNVEAGKVIAPAVTVRVLDTVGNPSTDSTASITLALGTNAGNGTLLGTRTVAAVNGVATFSDLSLEKAGTGYTLSASATGLTAATSSAFDVRASTPSALAFAQQPTNVEAGKAFTPAVSVRVVDVFGNAVEAAQSVTLTLGTNPGNGTLTGTRTVVVSAGLATFGSVFIDKVGAGYTLVASSGGLTPVTSTPFTVRAGAAARAAFEQQPTFVGLNEAIAPDVKVALQDLFGNTATSNASCTVALGTNPTTANLGGTKTVSTVNGVATFSNLTVDKVGSGYTLQATCGTFPAITSVAFNVMASGARRLAFGQQPSSSESGVAIAPAVTVQVLDAGGALTTSNATITLALSGGNGTLLGAKSVAAVNGVATFSDLAVDKVGTGYTLTATSPSRLTAATSAAFDITPGAPAKVAFIQQPSQVVAGAAITPAVTVAIQDAFGNTVPTETSQVEVSLGDNPGNALLSGSRVASAVAGVATFSNLSLDKAAVGYTLVATAPNSFGVTPAGSDTFTVTAGPAVKLAFVAVPTQGAAGQALTPAVDVAVVDTFGNQTASSASVTVALANNPGSATLAGTKTVAAVNGLARFSTLSLEKAAAGYTLSASATGLTGATSGAFTIVGGTPQKLTLVTQPADADAGDVLSLVTLSAVDAFGNKASTRVTASVGTGPTGAVLEGTLEQDMVDGSASFDDLVLEKAGAYTLRFSAPGVAAVNSNTFTVRPGSPVQLVFSRQPANGSANAPLTPAPQVSVLDFYGNPTTGTVRIALGANTAGATLGGTVEVATTNGVATFSNLTLDKRGTGYTLRATMDTMSVESTAFSIVQVSLVYTDPTVGRVRLVRNAASTPSLLILDLKANEALQGYSVGFNLPVEAQRVVLDGITPGTALNVGTGTTAVAAALPASGPLKGVLTSVVSQKAAGTGAVTSDTSVAASAVFYQLRLKLPAQLSEGIVFDGANLGALFHGSLRDRQGNEVVGRNGFGIGRLELVTQ